MNRLTARDLSNAELALAGQMIDELIRHSGSTTRAHYRRIRRNVRAVIRYRISRGIDRKPRKSSLKPARKAAIFIDAQTIKQPLNRRNDDKC